MTKAEEEAFTALLRLWDKHPYQQTLSDYYREQELMKILMRMKEKK
jgi:hypothetical protein